MFLVLGVVHTVCIGATLINFKLNVFFLSFSFIL